MPSVSNDANERQQQMDEDEAARRVQKLWRGQNEAKDKLLTPQARWSEIADNAELKAAEDGAQHGENDGRSRWQRATKYAAKLQDPNAMMKDEGMDVPDAARKNLETQHWLELIDSKHRYGSNLKYYFKEWKAADTEDNFFKWLDYGGGKDLDLKECSREQLEKERISYLTNEQRLNYLVQIDDQGRLHWARNNELVDTSAGQWADAGEGRGIVPIDSEDRPELEEEQHAGPSSPGSEAVNHYVEPLHGSSKLSAKARQNFTIKGLVNKLLRKTLQKNTWIYVSDTKYNIFVGIKKPGSFQHSSFLAGGKVTSAGLITVKDGVIHTLSPLSGHYRTSIDHFHQFLDALNKKGVDTSRVQVTKAELALWMLEHIAKAKKKQSTVLGSTKEKVTGMVSHGSRGGEHEGGDEEEEESEEDKAWKQEILTGRKSKAQEEKGNLEKNAAAEGGINAGVAEEEPVGSQSAQSVDNGAEGQSTRRETTSRKAETDAGQSPASEPLAREGSVHRPDDAPTSTELPKAGTEMERQQSHNDASFSPQSDGSNTHSGAPVV